MTLHGDLKFLPLAWHALASHCRLHKIKTEPTAQRWKFTMHDPGKRTTSNQQVTTLYLPIK